MQVVYAGHASSAFNLYLGNVLQNIARDVQKALSDNLVALVLGGGYGRGEGGVVVLAGQERPYNDLDFTLIVKNKGAIPSESLWTVQSKYQAQLGIHVDFSRPLTVSEIRHWPHWLMWYDLLNGHVVLIGDEDILRCNVPEHLRHPLPAIEGTRLLLNRGAGLLWALRIVRGIETAPDPDFVRRNYYKCTLALGDAILIAQRLFTTRYHGRDAILGKWLASLADSSAQSRYREDLQSLGKLYPLALEFKFFPDHVERKKMDEGDLQNLAGLWSEIFLYVEEVRTGKPWTSVTEYCTWNEIREPDQNVMARWPRNFVHNLRRRRLSLRYPREMLFRKLPELLGPKFTLSEWAQASRKFLELWQAFN